MPVSVSHHSVPLLTIFVNDYVMEEAEGAIGHILKTSCHTVEWSRMDAAVEDQLDQMS